jgi:hypothetical protein
MPIKTKSSILVINKEVTEGTPVLASAGSQVVALQSGFSFSPTQETLINDELRAGIAAAPDVPGTEGAEASFNHYIRHSGVEGQQPNYGELLESVFGSVEVEATEYDTTSGSTVSSIAMPVGEGANFQRGQPLLVKNTVREIRPIESVSGDNLIPAFDLASAPGTGVNLGKAVWYAPESEGHPTLTLDLFRGNGGIREVIAGGRVSELAITANAGEFITGAFTVQGVKYYFDPIEITATTKYLDFNDGSVKQLVLTEKVYRDPHELAQAIQDAFNVASSGWTVVYNDKGASKGKFTISKASGTASLLWNTGAQTANSIGPKIGFSTAADDTAALTYTSDNEQSWAFAYTPDYDDEDPLVGKAVEVLFGDQSSDIASQCVASLSATISNTIQDVKCLRAETAIDSKIISLREGTCAFTITAEKHDAEIWKQFRENTTVKLAFNFGRKTGGNWVAGKCGCLYFATAKLTEFNVDDQDDIVVITGTIKAFGNSAGEGEVYLGFV